MDPSVSTDAGVVALAGMKRALASLIEASDSSVDSAARVDRIRLLEELQSVAAAVMAVETVAFAAAQKAEQAAAGVPPERVGRGIAAQIGLARRMSPHTVARDLGNAVILTTELPATFAELAAGRIPQRRALLVARGTFWLSREHRGEVDRRIAAKLEQLGDKRTADLTTKLACELDPHGYLAHLRQAESERHVSIRPAPDAMLWLGALVPMAAGVAAYATLKRDADTQVGVEYDTRTRGQVMADLFLQRLTGQASPSAVPVAINLVMTDQTLLHHGEYPDEPAHLIGGGTIPAELARRIVTDASGEAEIFLRRLYTHPTTGQLAAMESIARTFTDNQGLFLLLRDQRCRQPWCDAPIRHNDHVHPVSKGGPTTTANGQGLSEGCNYAKQAPGWRHQTHPDGTIDITTPTGHHYRSPATSQPGARPHPTKIELHWRQYLIDRTAA